MTHKKTPKCIVLEPRFEGGNFVGYWQPSGTHYFDTFGHLYTFVAADDYNRIQDQLAVATESLEDYAKLGEGDCGTKYSAKEALKQIARMEAQT